MCWCVRFRFMFVCSCMPQAHTPLSAWHSMCLYMTEFITCSLKRGRPFDNKQRDLLSMTEHSCACFQSVIEDGFKLQQSAFLSASSGVACWSLWGISRLTPLTTWNVTGGLHSHCNLCNESTDKQKCHKTT